MAEGRWRNIARLFLIQPPIYTSEYSARGSEHTLSILPPMGLAYIAAYVRQRGHSVTIYDGMAEPLPLADIVKRAGDADVLGITSVSTFAVRCFEVARALKAAYPEKLLIMGGPHANTLPETCLEAGTDIVVMGEGEITTLNILEALNRGQDPRDLDGIVYRKGAELVRTPPGRRIEDLDEIPLPARDLLPMHLYHSSEARASRQPSHSLFTSRGCPGTCSFCNKKIFGSRTRYFGRHRIVEEFFLLRDAYGARDVAVWDDNFVADREVAHAVCDGLIKGKFDRTWSVEARIDAVDRELLGHLRAAGCDFIAYGIESGSQAVLHRMNKRITLGQIRDVVAMTKKAGLKIRGYFMMGMPEETLADMQSTIDFAISLDLDVASFTLFVPLPGTLDYRRALRSGTFTDPEYYLHGVYPEFNFPDSPLYVPAGMTSGQLMAKHREAYNRYYFRPSFILRNALSIRGMEDIRRYAKGLLNLMGNLRSR